MGLNDEGPFFMIRKNALIVAGVVLLIAGGFAALGGRQASDPQDLRDAIDTQIHKSPAALFGRSGRRPFPARMDPTLVRLYHERDMQPCWVTVDGPNGKAQVLRSVLAAAATQGLDPADYGTDQIAGIWDRKDVEGLARLELLLTVEYVAYVSDLVVGRRQPRDFDQELFPTACACELDQAALFTEAVAATDLGAFLEAQAPPFPQYQGLRDKLAEFRGLAARGGWPSVPAGRSLKPGASDPRVAAVRKRLTATGEWIDDGSGDSFDYDDALVAAVENFQRHQGLETDGIIGPATLAAMNVPVEARIRQLIINMESWRWVGRDHGDWWLEVNIPSFSLSAVRNGRVDLSMPVIVGDEYHMTPVFSDRLRYVQFNPSWDVPLSIAQKEILPKLQKDPSYLGKERIRLFAPGNDGGKEIDAAGIDWSSVTPDDMAHYSLKQDPGPANSLGRLAFIFPNPYDVYLHDTPALELFSQQKRAFSHGCIRVARARELAAYVLGGPDKGWTEDRIQGLIEEGTGRVVHLESSLPIYILYNTAAVDIETHDLYFSSDVYGRDALLEKAIF
jgi:murein L,D-transpeptidase YcbB/YkuD